MSRLKLVMLSAIAALTVSAVAAGTASAAAETRYFIEQTEVSAAKPVTGSSGVSKLESTIAGTKIIIECKKDTFKGEISTLGKSTGEVKFEECGDLIQRNSLHVRETLTTCEVESPITFKFTDQLIAGVGGTAEDEFLPETPPLFVKIKVNTCATFKGTYEAKGAPGQICALPEGEVEKVEHEIVCTSTGSKITLGKEPASFTSTDTVKLESGKVWRG